MFANSRRITVFANRLATRNNYQRMDCAKSFNANPTTVDKQIHTSSSVQNYVLPIPNNIDPAETTRFSPNRARDISATVIISHYGAPAAIDITADNSVSNDPHTDSYDCFGAVSLNSAMQSNVPTPFGGMHKFSHLNMPGGQWSQEPKFTSQNLHSSHYTALREQTRAGWVSYNQDAIVHKKEHATSAIGWNSALLNKRSYCTKTDSTDDPKILTKKEQLKRAFKDYGSTVIIFHIGISLISLGGCYLLVSGGIDILPILEYFGFASSTLVTKIATGSSTFLVAYAIHKVFAMVRISITLAATPFIVRYLRSKGYLKVKVVKQK